MRAVRDAGGAAAVHGAYRREPRASAFDGEGAERHEPSARRAGLDRGGGATFAGEDPGGPVQSSGTIRGGACPPRVRNCDRGFGRSDGATGAPMVATRLA